MTPEARPAMVPASAPRLKCFPVDDLDGEEGEELFDGDEVDEESVKQVRLSPDATKKGED